MKKMMAGTMAAVMAAAALTGCGSSSGTTAATTAAAAGTEAAETTAAGTEAAAADGEGKTYKVGILKYMDHPSLNQIEENVCKELEALSADGVTYEYEDYDLNGQGDASVLNQMAAQLLADGVDAIVPIATPAAQIVQSATEGQNLPIVFSAVSDPVSAKLVASMEEPGANITGT